MLGILVAVAPAARAIDFFDGRAQIHGFGEMQIRALDRDFHEELDLAQWYNVINIEMEFDLLPDGWGPFDLLQAYVRVEGRYDCIYSHGCGMFPAVNTYGDDARRLPLRLRDARDEDYGGAIDANAYTTPAGMPLRISNKRPSRWAEYNQVENPDYNPDLEINAPRDPSYPQFASPGRCPVNNKLDTCPDNRPMKAEIRKREGFPGFDTLFDLEGADGEIGDNPDYDNPNPPGAPYEDPKAFKALARKNDDPAVYALESVLDWRFAFREWRGPQGSAGQTLLMAPWLPKNFFQTLATLSDRAHPMRGRRTQNTIYYQNTIGPQSNRGWNERYHVLDEAAGIAPPGAQIDPIDPRLQTLDTLLQTSPLNLGGQTLVGAYPNQFFRQRTTIRVQSGTSIINVPFTFNFGGDFSGILPCFNPAKSVVRSNIPQSTPDMLQAAGLNKGRGCIPFNNLRTVGGTGELPLRPAADISNLSLLNLQVPQGLYLPSPGLRRALATQDFDEHPFNIDELDRSFNRGWSQSDTYEIKEAYADMEFLDSRLWLRIGLQNIVWGKTELFRTTDQFNPQDFALASLPALEESRIALFSARAVYSLYDVGPLEDVRLEIAANFDDMEPADLGACGEPYTIDIICAVTTGFAIHGLTGVGIAGVDRPEDPWDDIKGVEFGGRVEFRWDRFSFAITDFYGYNDFPYADPIFFYERNVDPSTGRPRIAEAVGKCENGAGIIRRVGNFFIGYHGGNYLIEQAGDPTAAPSGTANNFNLTWYNPNNPASDRGPINANERNQLTSRLADDWSRQLEAYGVLGVGTDADCLKPGGAPGAPNENRFNPALAGDPADFNTYSGGNVFDPASSYINSTIGQWQLDGSSEQNALLNHPGNMQLFQLICLGTVTIAAALDPAACAWNIWNTAAPLISTGSVTTFALGELISSLLAGEKDLNLAMSQYLVIQQNTKGSGTEIVPVQSMNRDERDGRVTSFNTHFTRIDPFAPVSPTNPFIPNFSLTASLTMDSTMTAEQRALVGCGPFYGTRCDSSVVEFDTGGSLIFSPGGGLDYSNGEASAFTMSFPGTEGTRDGWRTTSGETQPGTIGFEGGEHCTRYVPGHELADEYGLVTLPGCRGAEKLLNQVEIDEGTATEIQVLFERGYTPLQDGCIFGPSIAGLNVVAYQRNPENGNGNTVVDPNSGEVYEQDDQLLRTCNVLSSSMRPTGTPYVSSTAAAFPAQTLFHPLAGCENLGPTKFVRDPSAPANDPTRPDPVSGCLVQNRNYAAEFLQGNAQIFQSEMAVWSWNLLQFLITTTCNSTSGGDDINDPDCFNPAIPWAVDRCSFTQPQLCRNVKGILAVAGLNRNDVRAGGNPTYGRRDFIWHSGGELALRYARRNVFGFSMDFAEDHTKTNWGVEFTWIGDVPYLNNNSYDQVSDSQAFNLTVSVDRPTFVNFLNANRTFFINSQWFFQYLPEWEKGYLGPAKGPFNVLFTFAVFTGYYQDRLLPQLVTVYDFNSQSGGFLPTITYRFTEAFSMTVGVSFFIGRGQLVDMPVRGFAPVSNRAGPKAYKNGTENLLSLIRHRDEAFMRIRWTF